MDVEHKVEITIAMLFKRNPFNEHISEYKGGRRNLQQEKQAIGDKADYVPLSHIRQTKY